MRQESYITIEGSQVSKVELYDDADFSINDYFEIVGLFDVNHDMIYLDLYIDDSGFWPRLVNEFDSHRLIGLYNQFYIPHTTLEHFSLHALPYILKRVETFVTKFDSHLDVELPSVEYPIDTFEVLFFLDDPRNFFSFQEKALEVLPPGWGVVSTVAQYTPVVRAVDSITEITDFFLIFSISITVMILSILFIFIIKDRRYEIGVYLALGEKKLKIYLQFLCEIFIVSFFALSFAFVLGYFVNQEFSFNLFENEILNQVRIIEENSRMVLPGGQIIQNIFNHPTQLAYSITHFRTEPLSVNEIIDMFQVTLDANIILLISIGGMTLILFSSVIPIILLFKMKTKNILSLHNV